MSTINNALSKLAEHEQASLQDDNLQTIERVNVSPVKSSRLAWAIGGFTLSLGIGAWAVSSGSAPTQPSFVESSTGVAVANSTATDKPSVASSVVDNTKTAPINSNTSKLIENTNTTIYSSKKPVELANYETDLAHEKSSIKTAKVDYRTEKLSTEKPSIKKTSTEKATSAPIKIAANQPKKSQKPEVKRSTTKSYNKTTASHSSMQVQQVELTHQQMAEKAKDRASKALESNDFETASTEYRNALRYVPKDETIRRKLAALYYGNRQIRKSAELLEEGIKLNKNSNDLRLSLATILIKEQQPDAALSALGYIPDHVSDKYLATRAALAQQLKKNDWALQSYQMLIKRDPENGRWWLGLGIQQERIGQPQAALTSYTNALTMVGLSSQSQTFIRSRMKLLESNQQGAE